MTDGSETPTLAPKPDAPKTLAGKNVLVVEDEIFVGADLQHVLEQNGATVALVNSADDAMAALDASRFDAAILDVHLQNDSSYAIADKLRELGTPFAFLSGYLTVREGYSGVPFLSKPAAPDEVTRAIAKLLA